MPMHAPAATTERDCLLGFLGQQRDAVKTAAYGLSDEQAAATPSASGLSAGAIIKHLAYGERNWIGIIHQVPGAGRDFDRYMAGLHFDAGESLVAVLADYEAATQETDACIAAIADLGQAVSVPKGVPWFPADIDAWSVRWVLGHLIEETARHAGHADVIRESIDGASAGELLAAVEDWEPTPWLQPWRPPAECEPAGTNA
jgi:Protein of unknown function (DUF664)